MRLPTTGYVFDDDGERVKKSGANPKLYWRGTGMDALAESDLSGNMLEEYVFFGGKRIARRDSGGNVFYYMADNLESDEQRGSPHLLVSPHSRKPQRAECNYRSLTQEISRTPACAILSPPGDSLCL